MTNVRSARWLMSFADLTLLLLAFFVLLHARADGHAAAASVRTAFGGKAQGDAGLDLAAATLFQPGEAVLTTEAAGRLHRFGAQVTRHHSRIRIDARGSAAASSRLDAWELSAARAAAVARAIGAGGLDPQAIDIAMPQGPERAGPQHFTIRTL